MAVTIGTTAVKCPTAAAYTGVVTVVPAATAINSAIGETGVHVSDDDPFSAMVRCHDANGELYNVAVTRPAVTVSGYEVDAVPALAQAHGSHCIAIRTAPAGRERPAGPAGPMDRARGPLYRSFHEQLHSPALSTAPPLPRKAAGTAATEPPLPVPEATAVASRRKWGIIE